MNSTTTTGMTFLQQFATAMLQILVTGINTTITFGFQVLSALISGILARNGLGGTGSLFGS